MDNEFPPNSHSKKEERPDRHPEKTSEKNEVVRITRSKATLRKKSLRKRFVEAFKPEDNVSFVEYTLFEVLVPGIKDAVADATIGTIENALGSNTSRHRRRRGGDGYTSYNRMSDARPRGRRGRDRDDEPRDRRRERMSRRSSDIPEVLLDTRVEAEETIDGLFELISKYEVATMRDLLSMIGEPHNPTDEDWGWTDLRGARIHRVGGRYLLDLPRPESLD